MNPKARFAGAWLAAALLVPHHAAASTAPEERLADARARSALARAEFSRLLATYHRVTLEADDAVAASLDLRRRTEELRAALRAERRTFAASVARAYIDGSAAIVEAVLSARDVADLNALMPFAESNLAVRITDARALTARRRRLEGALREAARSGELAVAKERVLQRVAEEIAARLAAAEAAVRAARADVAAAQARRRLDLLNGAWAATSASVNLSLRERRRERGERLFREAEPYLGPRPRCDAPRGLRSTGMTLAGKASWYGNEFRGKPTASGAVYDPWRYTVAHRELPFGLFLLIKSDGKCVLSLLNDRGPYIYDRILDLSAGSARAVDLTGVERVDAMIFVRE